MYGGIYEQRTVIMFALISGAGYEQRTSHNVRIPLGALDADGHVLFKRGPLESQSQRVHHSMIGLGPFKGPPWAL